MNRTVNIACLQTRPMPDFVSASREAMLLAQRAVDAGAQFQGAELVRGDPEWKKAALEQSLTRIQRLQCCTNIFYRI